MTFPAGADRNEHGNAIGEASTFEFLDCSTSDLVCADFEEFMFAVPRNNNGRKEWSRDDWRFKRTACFIWSASKCIRFAVRFSSEAERTEGGFIYSDQEGIELYYYANVELKDPRHIYVKSTRIGLLHGGRA